MTTQSLPTPHGEIVYLFKRSPKRRTLTITVHPNSQVIVSAPQRLKEKAVHQFIQDKAHWIKAKLNQAQDFEKRIHRPRFMDQEEFLFMGEPRRLSLHRQQTSRSVDFDGQCWHLSAKDPALIKRLLIKWYRQQAQEVLGSRLFHQSRLVGIAPQKVAVRTHKRLWGVCHTRTKKIYLNWQLIMAPLDVIDYVIIHELCHLFVANHSRRFWNKVAQFCPDYKRHHQWLKDHQPQMMWANQ